MKKIIFILIISLLPISLYSQRDNLELGIRYLKLGNSHRIAKNYSEALGYLKSGLEIVQKANNKYWEAVGYELFAYYYCDRDDKFEALFFLDKANELYRKTVNSPKDGSHNVLDEIIEEITNNGCPCCSNDDDYPFTPGSEENSKTRLNFIKVFNYDNSRLNQLPSIPLAATNISLAFNRFTNIPGQLNQYNSLEHLNIPDNRIRDLTGIGNLKGLHYLNLSKNRIAEIPDDIEKLNNLVELDLSNNRIKKVNTGITKLKNLKILNLKGNKIPFEELKRVIQALPNTNIIHDSYKQK